jgi:hypothetical protein
VQTASAAVPMKASFGQSGLVDGQSDCEEVFYLSELVKVDED